MTKKLCVESKSVKKTAKRIVIAAVTTRMLPSLRERKFLRNRVPRPLKLMKFDLPDRPSS